MLVYQRVILNSLLLKEYLRSPAKNLYEFVMFCRVSKIPRSPDQQPDPPWVLWALSFGHFWNSKKRTGFPGWYRWCFSQSFQVCNFFSVYFGVAINIMLIYCTCLKLVWWNQSQPKIKFSREHDDEPWNDYLCSLFCGALPRRHQSHLKSTPQSFYLILSSWGWIQTYHGGMNIQQPSSYFVRQRTRGRILAHAHIIIDRYVLRSFSRLHILIITHIPFDEKGQTHVLNPWFIMTWEKAGTPS